MKNRNNNPLCADDQQAPVACDTIFDRAKRKIIQTFSPSVRLEVSLENSEGILFVHDHPKAKFDKVDTNNWGFAVAMAAELGQPKSN